MCAKSTDQRVQWIIEESVHLSSIQRSDSFHHSSTLAPTHFRVYPNSSRRIRHDPPFGPYESVTYALLDEPIHSSQYNIRAILARKRARKGFHSSQAHHIVGMSNDKVHSPEATSDCDESYDSAESDFLSIVPEDQRVSGD